MLVSLQLLSIPYQTLQSSLRICAYAVEHHLCVTQ